MPNTYTQLFIQIVFAVQGRHNFIQLHYRELIHKYITTVIQNDKHKMLAIFCMPDHLHMLVGLNPAISISDMVLDSKRASTNFLKEEGYVNDSFHWQKGYGAFSYSKSAVPSVINYILNQDQHHQQTSFRDEYVQLLQEFEIIFDENYLFEFYG